MHRADTLGGPVWWFGLLVLGTAWLLAGFVLVDQVRGARRAHLAERPVARAAYLGCSALFFAMLPLAQVPALRTLAGMTVLAAPFMVAMGVTYLLTVVYPKAGASDREGPADPR